MIAFAQIDGLGKLGTAFIRLSGIAIIILSFVLSAYIMETYFFW